MSRGNSTIPGFSSSRTTPGVSQYSSNTKGLTVAVITSDRVINDNLKSQIKIRILHTCRLLLLLPTLFLQYTQSNKFRNFSKKDYFTFLVHFQSVYKRLSFIKAAAFFSDVISVLNYQISKANERQ